MKSFIYLPSILLFLTNIKSYSQTYPAFGPEKLVTISGLTTDAMEPFISPDGNTLFFNNLNDGITTKLFYATKIDDTTFNFVGELNGTNQTITPYMDAVADMDSLENFYWTSTRNYPAEMDNLYRGTYSAGSVIDTGRVHGDFNIPIPGWLIMDHGISYDGQLLYYNNARFDGNNCSGPCETKLGIASKVNDTTFNTIANSSSILQNINDTSYIYYAPCITKDNLELYYTRFPKGTITASTPMEICVAVRTTSSNIFSIPQVVVGEPITNFIEAPTLTTDKQIMYYHRKNGGTYVIAMRYRDQSTNILSSSSNESYISIYPNPTNEKLNIDFSDITQMNEIRILNLLGETVLIYAPSTTNTSLDVSSLKPAIYIIQIGNLNRKIKIE